ncbi:hypothetical protein FZC76_03055 [Sutcliffiella horikoshii]|uniref:Uncharacterized protein n=1 Tax=Sutcliffiella horikoshii TaxID=79883 RepID=A0A5D4T7L6_9BACI|nr:hypothetical protein FZC76_03055 [Sutcliffiella horikoshii]
MFGHLDFWFGQLSKNFGQLFKNFGQFCEIFGQLSKIFGHLLWTASKITTKYLRILFCPLEISPYY